MFLIDNPTIKRVLQYRKLVLTGVFCRYSRRRAGLERIYVVGLEIIYVFLDPLASAKGWNVEPNGTTGLTFLRPSDLYTSGPETSRSGCPW